ncbi:hypothetical protein ARMSODRAFT_956541 [Armillaria solidipes]|uniref:Yeast cell wall synthesis Kre9/Knh1-like N-terminal domain-containing protein n=1 Tax=Armillaria solidipes TaxID=1076256 RepID=A0A2H3BFX6_9AGAR|nr:hypothetical protein ARMSODRAFT_956541 [Armillaria solidipes]
MLSFVLSIAFVVALVRADVVPTAPGPNDVFNASSPCLIKWNVDTDGDWKNMTIKLMAGSNDNMQLVETVAVGLDGTDSAITPFSWTCPSVAPYSHIYFYEFTNGNDTGGSKWTTRFTIASPSGETTPPEHSSQPNGDNIPWGSGSTSDSDTKTGSRTYDAQSDTTAATSTRMHKLKATKTASLLDSSSDIKEPTLGLPSKQAQETAAVNPASTQVPMSCPGVQAMINGGQRLKSLSRTILVVFAIMSFM